MRRILAHIRPIAVSFVLSGTLGAAGAAESPEPAEAVRRAQFSVVSIRSVCVQKGLPEERVGSGFVVRPGILVTRVNVVAGASEVTVILSDGRSASAKILSRAAEAGLAVLGFPFEDVPPLPEGRSDALTGDSHLAILGNSLGLFPSMTMGTFAGRRADGMMEINCLVPPGNGGGPVLDEAGRLVGMVVGRVHREGSGENRSASLGVALPVEALADALKIAFKTPAREGGWAGISVVDLESGSRKPGVRVVGLAPGGPGALAKICEGDTLIRFEGAAIKNADELAERVRKTPPNTVVVFSLQKGKTLVQKQVQIGRLP